MTATRSIDAVVLAAGRSARMQRPKPLLEIGSETFLERTIRVLRDGGCRHIVAVLNGEDEWPQRLADAAGAAVVINYRAGSQQLDSLRLGIGTLPGDWTAVAVLPVDVPLVSVETVRTLVAACAAHPAPLTVPFHNGVAGHPVVIDRSLADELALPLPEGVRSLIMKHAHELQEVKVPDPGVLIDIDTPDDYWRYIKDRSR